MADTATDTTAPAQEPRKVRDIAAEIRSTWPKIYFGAEPYVEAMEQYDTPEDTFITENGGDIIRRFLVNAGTWRGDDARRIKAELKAMVGLK